MKVIGVIDVRGGRAVRARAGPRAAYAPVTQAAGAPVPSGDYAALARAYLDRLGVAELYLADLDAIETGRPCDAAVASLAALGRPLWVDAGVFMPGRARELLALGAARVIVALETLPSFAALEEVCRGVGSGRAAFSLDLRGSKPILAAGVPVEPAPELARRAAAAGAAAVIVLDLARVGTASGPDFETVAAVRRAVPGVLLAAGGGVRGAEDLARLAECGCDAALVASALLDGRITGSVRPG